MNPPVCRFCKKAEWNHRCIGPASHVKQSKQAIGAKALLGGLRAGAKSSGREKASTARGKKPK